MGVIKKIRGELKNNVDEKYKKTSAGFFKEKVKILGVRAPVSKKIAGKYFNEIKNSDKKRIFALCEQLLKSGYNEESSIALDWAYRLKNQYQKQDFKIFEQWLKKYVSNWASCDDLCTHSLGYSFFKFPELIPKTKKWAVSKNRWMRRASAIVLIYSVRNKKHLNEIFEVSDILLLDSDDLVQKGYGWTLKEASNVYQKEVFDFVMKRKNRMPRTALRYAIEKMPKKLKKEAMRKNLQNYHCLL